MKTAIGILLFSISAMAGQFEDRVRIGEQQLEAAWKAKAENRRAQSHQVFARLVSGVVANRFGGFRDGMPAIRGSSHDGGALYMGENLGTSEFTTRTNLVCKAWGNAVCPVNLSKCELRSTKVECVDAHGKITDSGWINRTF